MAATIEVICACGKMFAARTADRKRGWAKSCSKSCAAIKSNFETGKYEKFKAVQSRENGDWDGYEDGGWDAHKEQF